MTLADLKESLDTHSPFLAMSSIYFWTDLFDVLNLPIYDKSLTTITESLTVQ